MKLLINKIIIQDRIFLGKVSEYDTETLNYYWTGSIMKHKLNSFRVIKLIFDSEYVFNIGLFILKEWKYTGKTALEAYHCKIQNNADGLTCAKRKKAGEVCNCNFSRTKIKELKMEAWKEAYKKVLDPKTLTVQDKRTLCYKWGKFPDKPEKFIVDFMERHKKYFEQTVALVKGDINI
jgi:hypothetical protein